MEIIDLQNWKRKKHFDFFNGLDYPHFNMCAMVDLARFVPFIKENEIGIFYGVLYAAVRAANEIPSFLLRIRNEQVVRHTAAHPSYTSMSRDQVFSFTDVQYDPDYHRFFQNCEKAEHNVFEEPSLEDDPHRDDYLFVSCIPWVHFTSFVHPVHISGVDSVPRLTWGKYLARDGRLDLPFSVQVHHALADGWDVGEYYKLLQHYLNEPEECFRSLN